MHASDNSSHADKLGKYDKSDHPQETCRLRKSLSEEESPGRQNQPSQGLFIENSSQVRSVRRNIRTPPLAQILFVTQLLIIFILDAFSLLKLSLVQQNSPNCKNESNDTCQEASCVHEHFELLFGLFNSYT